MSIKTSEFSPTDSRWKDLYLHFKKCGYDVYAPAQKIGDCVSPYLVVKNDGAYKILNYSSNKAQYAIYVYVPKDKYSLLEPMVQKVKDDMRELYPMFRQYGQELASFYDDTIKAHYIALEYENIQKIIPM